MGAVHDFSALILSARNEGKSIGELCAELINPRVRTLFLLIIFFLLLIVIAIFCLVIALLFDLYPQAVLPVWLEIPIALWLGYMIYRRGGNLTVPMVFMITMTTWTMISNVGKFYADGKWHLFLIGLVILALEVWMIIESFIVLKESRRK